MIVAYIIVLVYTCMDGVGNVKTEFKFMCKSLIEFIIIIIINFIFLLQYFNT
jgi:hypothetical protein